MLSQSSSPKISFIQVNSLKSEEKLQYLEKIYPLYDKLFHGKSKQEFYECYIDNPLAQVDIELFTDNCERVVGFEIMRFFNEVFHSHPVTLCCLLIGIDKEYRRKSDVASFVLRESAKFKLLHPFRKLYCINTVINPASYRMIARYAYEMYPRYNTVPDDDLANFLIHAADKMGFAIVDNKNHLIRKTGNVVKMSPKDRIKWQSESDPHVQFYVNETHLIPGHGLLTLMPGTLKNLVFSVLKYWLNRLF